MSQSTTIMDARTQLNCTVSELNVIRALLHEERTDIQGRMFHKINKKTIDSLKNKLKTTKYRMDEFGLYELIEYDGTMIKQYLPEDKDTPVYPEPEGDPSY